MLSESIAYSVILQATTRIQKYSHGAVCPAYYWLHVSHPFYGNFLLSFDCITVGGNSSQVPLLRDTESVANAGKKHGMEYRVCLDIVVLSNQACLVVGKLLMLMIQHFVHHRNYNYHVASVG